MNHIGKLRVNSGKSLREVSEEAKIPYNTIRNYEKGYRKVTGDNISLLSKYYNVSPAYIIGVKEFEGDMISIPKDEYERLKQIETQLEQIKQLLK